MSLRGVAWDHRRCWGPLEASVEPYRAATGQEVSWGRRSLYSFGEGDLGVVCAAHDLVIYDHPFVGEAAERGWLQDLSAWLTEEDRATFMAEEVGPSWQSYHHGGGVWALPIDTAAQTAAWRPDLLADEPPSTIEDVLFLGDRLNGRGQWVAWPAVPTDQMCTLLTVAASLGLTPGRDDGPFLAPADAEEIVGLLRALLAVAHPRSRDWNPIRCLDHMVATDEIAYVPWLFNYVNYATSASGPAIRFGAAPGVAPGSPARTLLGGAGIGVSAAAQDPRAAFDYALWLCRPELQAGFYVEHGGQPGMRSAWASLEANARTAGFFAGTLPVLDAAWLRPTYAGFMAVFHEATSKLPAVLLEGAPVRPFVEWLNAAHDRHRTFGIAA